MSDLKEQITQVLCCLFEKMIGKLQEQLGGMLTKDKVAELEAVSFLIKVKEPPPTEPKVVTFRTPRLFSFTSAIMNPLSHKV